jgi:hypothetical protein
VGTPKSEAGIRDVTIPPHLLPLVKEHLRSNITGGRDGLLLTEPRGVVGFEVMLVAYRSAFSRATGSVLLVG